MLSPLRTAVRKNSRSVIDHLVSAFLIRKPTTKARAGLPPVCLFCYTGSPLTKEHVFPKWAFENKPESNFVSKINGLSHKYGKTTLSACARCNNELLAPFEKKIVHIFQDYAVLQKFLEDDQLEDIIRWLEILDYKFQVFSLATKFRAHKKTGHIPFLSDYPISALDANVDYSPKQVVINLRQSLKRLAVKSKAGTIKSLVIFKSHNPNFHFFHKNNDYIFVELANKKLAMFYFYKQVFDDIISARDAALAIIKEHY